MAVDELETIFFLEVVDDADNDDFLSCNEFCNYRAIHMRPDRRQFSPGPGASAPPLGPMPGEGRKLVFDEGWMLVYLFGLGLRPGDLVLLTKHVEVTDNPITI